MADDQTQATKPTRAVIAVNGELPNLDAARSVLSPGGLLIAADGGLRHFMALGVMPALLIGDLDSVAADHLAACERSGVEIRRYPPAKDLTDLELALLAALEVGCDSITFLGGMGGRLDHTLGNLFLLLSPDLIEKNARFDDGVVEAFIIRREAELHGAPGDLVSLLPLGEPARGIVTFGLEYPLRGETLHPERSRGISNVMLFETARVYFISGKLLCIHTRRLPGEGQ